MPISIVCRCGYNISAPERLAGRTLRCPKCLGEFTVPQVFIPPAPAPRPMAAYAPPPAAFVPPPDATIPEAGFPMPEALAEIPLEQTIEMSPDMAAPASEPFEMSPEATMSLDDSALDSALDDSFGMPPPARSLDQTVDMPPEEPMDLADFGAVEAAPALEEAPMELAEAPMELGEGDLTMSEEAPLVLSEGEAPAEEFANLDDDALGMFLMDDDPPADPKKKK